MSSDEPIDALQENEPFFLSAQDSREINRARKSTIYELFILGELMDEPHHGYQLREILSNLLGPFRQISWGVLYPLIRQLEHERLLVSNFEARTEESERGTSTSRQRKQYAITETGRERFYRLMLEPGDYNTEYRELFTIKLNNFDHLARTQQLAVLWQYRGCLQFEDFYLNGAQQHVSTASGIPEKQRAHILRTISFKWSSIRGEIQWIEQQVACLEEEPGELL